MMDDILLMFGRVVVAALIAGVATEIIKRFPLQRWKDTDYFSVIVYGLAIVFSFLITFIMQRLGEIPAGWETLVVAGILTAGLSMLGYEGVEKVFQFVSGNRTGRDTVNIQDVHGENIDIGGG